MHSRQLQALRKLSDAWWKAIRKPRRRAKWTGVLLLIFVGLLIARAGTDAHRLGIAIGLGCVIAILIVLRWIERRAWRKPEFVIHKLAHRVDPDRAIRAARAFSLINPSGDPVQEGVSRDLARLHVARVLAALPERKILARARRLGKVYEIVGGVLIAGALLLVLLRAPSLAEGADILFARNGLAPVHMNWLEQVEVEVRPPDYLHEEARPGLWPIPLHAFNGSVLTIRGVAIRTGRRLVLTDGNTEIPFVEDGTDHLVARWTIQSDVKLRIAARFGQVRIDEPEALEVRFIADSSPRVNVEGAPKRIAIADTELDVIPIRYEANDDHGLREVHLVLRSGSREDRRVLARLDGETRSDRGGYSLRLRDPFVRKSQLPIEVRVEAKDNDPLTGPKWGTSEAITLVPPDVGEAEARRVGALRDVRDALVDSLGIHLEHEIPRDLPARGAWNTREREGLTKDRDLLVGALGRAYLSLRVPGRLQAILNGQARTLLESAKHDLAAGPSHSALAKTYERVVLVTDGIVRGMGTRDARQSARVLAEVADELATASAMAAQPSDRGRARDRVQNAMNVLEGGTRTLPRMGGLGHELAHVITNDRTRVQKGLEKDDFVHVELAARDLAARLHQPDYSFEVEGRQGQGGGESGGSHGLPGEQEEDSSDSAERAYEEAASELNQLSRDQTDEMSRLEEAIRSGDRAEDRQKLVDEAKKHAQSIRQATRDLPSIGFGSDSWTSKGATAKEHAEQMAQNVEQGDLAQAVENGQNTLNALEDAKRTLERQRGTPRQEAAERIENAHKKIDAEQRWLEEQLKQARKRAAERASKQLGETGEAQEKIAERAQKAGKNGEEKGVLPPRAVDSLEQAAKAARDVARALEERDVDRAMKSQREAERQLETAKQALQGEESDEPSEEGRKGERDAKGNEEGGRQLQDEHTEIPKAGKGPGDFRNRVVRESSQPSPGRLKDAWGRYVRGLLR